jgi:phage shock protein A
VVDKNLNIMLANSPTRKKILDQVYADLNSGTINADEAISRYQELVKDNAEALKAEGDSMAETFGTISALDKGMDAQTRLAEGQQDLAARGLAARQAEVEGIGNTVEQMKLLSTNVDKLNRVIDPLRESIIQAEQVTRTKMPEQINNLTGAMAMFVDKLGPKGLAGVMDEQFKMQEKYMKMYLGLVAEGPKVQPAGKIAEVGAKAGEILLGAVGKLSGAVNNLDAIITHLRTRLKFNKGTLGVGGEYFRDFGAGTLVELHGMEAVMTPKQVQELLQNAQAGVMKGLAAATSTDPADSAISAESAKMSETVTSTLSTLATQITNSNQAQISKLDELISTMRDKTIWEDMLRATEDTAENTRKMTNALA